MPYSRTPEELTAVRDKVRKVRADWATDRETGNPDDRLMHPQFGLGVKHRCKIVQLLGGLTDKDFSVKVSLSTSQWQAITQRSGRDFNKDNVKNVLPTINALFRADDDLITEEMFLKRPFFGANAVENFAFWLKGFRDITDADDLLVSTTPFGLTPEREDLQERIEEFLRSDGILPILNIHQVGMEKSLTALAAHICEEFRTPDTAFAKARAWRPFCYLPVGRHPRTRARVTLQQLLAWLLAFYSGESVSAARPISLDQVPTALQAVRKHLATTPAILIFDGHVHVGESIASLRGLVLDDAAHALLPHLIFPRLFEAEDAVDPDAFNQTRILLLSDKKLSHVGPFECRSYPLNFPPSETIPTLLAAEPYCNQAELNELLHERNTLGSSVDLGLIDTIVNFKKATPPYDWPALKLSILATDTGGLTRMLVEIMQDKAPFDLLVLRFIALATDGMRCVTLVRVLEEWGRITTNSAPAYWDIRQPWNIKTIYDARFRYGSLIISSEDERAPGIDDSPRSVSLMRPPKKPARSLTARTLLLDFRNRDLRELFLRDLVGNHAEEIFVCRMHHLIAEIAFEQQTLLMRHYDPARSTDARFFRRLFQGIFHGFCSLSRGPDATDPALNEASRILPTDPNACFKRLYTVFLRLIADAPPHWDIARNFGQERLKSDLLVVCADVDALHPYDRGRNYKPVLKDFLALDKLHLGDRNTLIIATDIFGSLAHSLFQLGQIDRAKEALSEAQRAMDVLSEAIKKQQPPDPKDAALWVDAELRYRVPLARTEIDLGLVSSVDNPIDTPIRRTLGNLSFTKDGFEVMEKMREDAFKAPDEAALRTALDANQIMKIYEPFSPGRRAACADLLARFGESIALRADVGLSPNDSLREFLSALIAFRVGDEFRRSAYDDDPFGAHYIASSHIMRTHARVALRLYKLLDQGPDTARKLFAYADAHHYFCRQARRQADILTRHHFRYASERPSILILESMFDRLVQKNLRAARKSLAQADAYMSGALDRPRVRMRFLMERAKVQREQALKAHREEDSGKARRLVKAAEYDVRRLQEMAKQHPFWNRMAERQRNQVNDAIAEIGHAGKESEAQTAATASTN